MATVAAAPHKAAIRAIADAYGSGVVSGIVPDSAHLDNGGYHCSINDLIAHGNGGDYSNTRSEDKAPPVTTTGKTFAAAGDISMSTADMIKFYGRVRPVYNDTSDPRRKYINAINCWDGSGDAVRLNFKTNTVGTASADHKWHNHLDQPRMYIDTARNLVEAEKAARALISVCTGQSKAAWLQQEEAPDVDAAQDKMLKAANARVDGVYSLLPSVTTSWSSQEPEGTQPNVLLTSLNSLHTKLNTLLIEVGKLPETTELMELKTLVSELDDKVEADAAAALLFAQQEAERDALESQVIASLPEDVVAQLAENPDDLAGNLKGLMTEQQWADFQASVAAAV
jgi:hypothetical protein